MIINTVIYFFSFSIFFTLSLSFIRSVKPRASHPPALSASTTLFDALK